jgi:hypothetical protein
MPNSSLNAELEFQHGTTCILFIYYTIEANHMIRTHKISSLRNNSNT